MWSRLNTLVDIPTVPSFLHLRTHTDTVFKTHTGDLRSKVEQGEVGVPDPFPFSVNPGPTVELVSDHGSSPDCSVRKLFTNTLLPYKKGRLKTPTMSSGLRTLVHFDRVPDGEESLQGHWVATPSQPHPIILLWADF